MRISDWSSDVCSSDLLVLGVDLPLRGGDRAEAQPLHLPHLRLVVVERQRAGDADAVVGEVRLEALRPGIAARAGRGRHLAGSGLPEPAHPIALDTHRLAVDPPLHVLYGKIAPAPRIP